MTAIHSYRSVGAIDFGMSSDQVRALLGEPSRITTNRFGEEVLAFDGINVCVSPSTGVVEVTLLPETQPTISDIAIFGSPWALRRLRSLDDAPQEVLGAVVFLKLGISVTGLHDGDDDQRAVSAFVKGRWDSFQDKMKPLT
jgi:hypothetical protein